MRGRISGLVAVGLLAAAGFGAGREAPLAAAPAEGRIPGGEYVEIDADGKQNRDFLLSVQPVSPNIIHIRGKNGWVAFASFDPDKKEYHGFFEWPELPGLGRPRGKWGDLYQIRVVMNEGLLRIEGKSAGNEMLIRARPTAKGPAPHPPGAKE